MEQGYQITQSANYSDVHLNNNQTNSQSFEIDMVLIIKKLYEHRKFIFISFSLWTITLIIIAFNIPEKYKIQTTLSQPNNNQIKQLYQNTDAIFTPDQLFTKFSKQLNSQGNIINFIMSTGIVEGAIKHLKMKDNSKERINMAHNLLSDYKINFVHHRKEDTKDNFNDDSTETILNTFSKDLDIQGKDSKAYIEYTNQMVLFSIVKEQQSIVDLKIKQLEKQIMMDLGGEVLERSYKIKTLENDNALKLAIINSKIQALKAKDTRDRSLQLEELQNALKIATMLGLNNPYQGQKVNDKNLKIEINSNHHDLYLYGSTYLKNAIKELRSKEHTIGFYKQLSALQHAADIIKKDPTIPALKNRVDDKPYLMKLKDKEIELRRLKTLTFDVSNVKLYQYEGEPFIDTSANGKKRKLIIATGILFGIVFACLAALILAQVKRIRRELTLSKLEYSSG